MMTIVKPKRGYKTDSLLGVKDSKSTQAIIYVCEKFKPLKMKSGSVTECYTQNLNKKIKHVLSFLLVMFYHIILSFYHHMLIIWFVRCIFSTLRHKHSLSKSWPSFTRSTISKLRVKARVHPHLHC